MNFSKGKGKKGKGQNNNNRQNNNRPPPPPPRPPPQQRPTGFATSCWYGNQCRFYLRTGRCQHTHTDAERAVMDARRAQSQRDRARAGKGTNAKGKGKWMNVRGVGMAWVCREADITDAFLQAPQQDTNANRDPTAGSSHERRDHRGHPLP